MSETTDFLNSFFELVMLHSIIFSFRWTLSLTTTSTTLLLKHALSDWVWLLVFKMIPQPFCHSKRFDSYMRQTLAFFSSLLEYLLHLGKGL